jgi:hypothetical protein
MTEKRCFFGSSYSGQQCRCGWRKEMIKDVPKGYIHYGHITFFMLNQWSPKWANGATLSSYGHRSFKAYKKEERSPGQKHGTFYINHDTHHVLPKGDWPDSIQMYLNNALVKKEGGVFTCIGVANDDDDDDEEQKKSMHVHMDEYDCMLGSGSN